MEMLQYVVLLMIVLCVSGQSLTSSDSVVKRPGESVSLSCIVSGFSVSGYWMHWIRQKPGRGLEWIGRRHGSTAYYAQSLQGQFSITKDTSKNMLYLEVKSLKTEDTAVYYCARDWADAFDYWGKGTRVIVTGEAPKPPAVLMMSSCERSSTPSSDSLILGCLASGYSPAESVSFKWTDQSGKALTDFIQYPSGNTTLTVSHITISKTKFNQSKIICAAEHPSETISQTFRKVHTQTPTLSLAPVTTPKSTSVMCVIEDFYPEKLSVQWKVNDNNSLSQSKPLTKLNEDTGFYTAFSFYEVSSETWNTNPSYTCEVTHQGKPISVKGSIKAKFTLTLKPPIERELFVHNKIVLEAVVSGDIKETVQEASVSCKVKNEPVTSQNIIPGKAFADNSLFKRIHNVTIDTKKWFDGEMITCTIRDTNNNRDINQEIRFDKGDGKIPSVSIYRPDHNTSFSLVCEVTSPKLGNVYLMWKVGTDPYKEGKTSAPILREDYKSVLSILTVTKQQYHTTTFTCAVKHANMENMSAPLQVTTSPSKLPECPD